ncbi:hypothetical protein F4815DRAFT_502009 [Daldinia loculata]|nr:hypothetical protein F4815DRAFT_502009 [Daldinia loculata]
MSNYQSHILPALQQLSSSASEPIRVAYVTAESVGKSTRLVPDLWNHVKATRAGAQGLYILIDPEEAKVTSHDILSREAASVINEVPSIQNADQLGLISYECFNTLMEDTADPSTLLRHQDMILFVDIEYIPTVDGDLGIGIVVDWIRGLKTLQEVNLTVVLLAGNTREDIVDVLDLYDIHPLHLAWEEARNYEQKELKDTDEAVEAIRLALFESPQIGIEPYVVICAPIAEAYEIFIQPINRATGQDVRCLSLGNDSNMDDIARAIIEDKPTVLFLEDSLNSYIPVPNLRCVISASHKRVRIFDPSTSQFPMAAVPISEGDVFRQRAWASKVTRTDGDRPTFYTLWSDEWFRANKSKDNTHIHGDSMRLVLAASKRFNSIAYPQAPVPALIGNLSILREVHRRLVIMGCLADDAPTSKITPLGIRTLCYTKHKRFNRVGSIHVAYLLAQIETNTKLSIPSKRVLIRMVALTLHKSLYTLTEEAVESLKEEDTVALEAIIEDCAGIGKQNSHYGQLWCELGIWVKIEAEKAAIHTVLDGKTTIEKGEGYMRVNVGPCLQVKGYAHGLETHLGMEACKDPIAETMLTQHELGDVFDILARTYLFQAIFIPFGKMVMPNDMISLQPVRLGVRPQLVAFTPRTETGDPEKRGFFAIYQESLIYEGELAPVYITMLPGGVLQRIVDSFGAPDLPALVLTHYPVPTE